MDMLAAVNTLSRGAVGSDSVVAASELGNQAVLDLAENGRMMSANIAKAANILGSSEAVPVFNENVPENEFTVGEFFKAADVPDFSVNCAGETDAYVWTCVG